MTVAKASYRPDIDGLRAIAVLAVMAYHAFPSLLPGGFIGVDVFFVISGYLITLQISSDQERRLFRIADFYARRIRRIFPALILVLATVLGLGWIFSFVDGFRDLGEQVAAGAGFVSNISLLQQAGYFDVASDLKPLLHLWSLGVEEQFYFFWPLAIWLGYKTGRTHAVVIGLVVLSFAVNLFLVRNHPQAAFYLPITRLWELGFGGWLALATPAMKLSQSKSDQLSAAGFLFLLLGFI